MSTPLTTGLSLYGIGPGVSLCVHLDLNLRRRITYFDRKRGMVRRRTQPGGTQDVTQVGVSRKTRLVQDGTRSVTRSLIRTFLAPPVTDGPDRLGSPFY